MDGEPEGILEVMGQQWASMVSMGGMFVGTILLGLSIQPLYDIPEARAFGEEGASKGGYVAMEMMFILIFTVAIIWLARKGLDYIIKGIVIFALGMSLFYILLPYISLLYYLLGISSSDLILFTTIAASVALMILLVKFPEWYVVNTVGVLVGAGVITLIGVSFVPVLIIAFMIAAAIYDHWAVNSSKHMLELADTMIKNKLPVLLVAPKERGYSFIEEEESVMRSAPPEDMDWEDPVPNVKPKKGGRDALFMGLGDVIFPGMLVISAVSFLPETGAEISTIWGIPMYGDQLAVGLGTLFGGLCGYVALMTQVARGQAQAGLPLLNGGSILGYLISGITFLGPAALWQDVSFF
ncbi:MAG: presenilin family intramembrane aspartyl protease PSH [Candidatus Thermoplasmatota archaeon]|nr:presenilin family intramembrane aspartyl protease PSH [Candidatus Thermoplasmatota archaeon]